VLVGTSGRDRIGGRKRNDRVCGRGGRDRLRGGWGRDLVKGGRGRDKIFGGRHRDRLRGGPGRDNIRAVDGGRDNVDTGSGDDVVRVRDGVRDQIKCGAGDDTAWVDGTDALSNCDTVRLGSGPAGFSLPPWSDALWTDPSNYSTIQTGDLDGDGDAELFGRSHYGIEAYTFDEDLGQWTPLPPLSGGPGLSDAAGWDNPAYYATIQAANLDGGTADEIFARYAGGITAWKYQPATQSWETLPLLNDTRFAPSDDNGYGDPQYYLTFTAADLDGDNADEIVSRGSGGITAWKYNPSASGSWEYIQYSGPDAPSSPGWSDSQYYETFGAANLDGGNADEIFIRGADGILAWKYQPGPGYWQPLPVNYGPVAPSNANGYDDPQYYETFTAADLDGDNADEIVSRGSGGITAWKYDPSASGSWDYIQYSGADAPSSPSWSLPQYYQTFGAGDLDGDGAAEVYARGADGINAWKLGSNGWSLLPIEGDFSDAAGWSFDYYYQTIQTADIGGGSADELLGRFQTGMVTMEFNPTNNSWAGLSAQFPAYTSGDVETAYQAINENIGGTFNPGFDIREQYSGADYQQLVQWHDDAKGMSQPQNVSVAAWKEVKNQILSELTNAEAVAYWYEVYLHNQAEDLYVASSMDTTGDVLDFDVSSNDELAMEEWDLFESILEGVEVLDALPDAAGEASVVLSSLLAGGTSAGFSVEQVNTAVDGVDGTYLEIRQQLQADFGKAIGGLAEAESAINGDHGLQSTVGGLINSGAWTQLSGQNLDTSLAAAERGYSLSVSQTITAAIWIAFRYPDSQYDAECTGGSVDDPCDWQDPNDPNGNWWQLTYTRAASSACETLGYAYGPCQPVHIGLRQQLFGNLSPACKQNWDERSCNLGVPYSDVFYGEHGWQNLPLWTCTDGQIFVSNLSCQQER
jgi:hypothetical protein